MGESCSCFMKSLVVLYAKEYDDRKRAKYFHEEVAQLSQKFYLGYAMDCSVVLTRNTVGLSCHDINVTGEFYLLSSK